MPTAARPSRSLLAFALVASLLAAVVPSAIARERAGDGPTRAATMPAAVHQAPDRSEPTARPRATSPARVPILGDWTARPKPSVPEPRATAQSKVRPVSSGSTGTGSSALRGRNHVWIPALGINRSVAGYSCSSSAYPGNRVYRWGCAGSNNIYLFGHAHSVFRPLHDAYVGGRLRKGMKVFYAAGDGRVGTYSVLWWKVTTPDRGAWAYAAQRRPSLTLQTCVGARSQYRLVVRLAKVG
jgi:hypothetical protein